ncbi:ComEA family DNA-binding protein [Actinomadura sp. 9N407]|uniref:ComEA family DNA-binding protein n=1 Tax=Actinomadura sp. 9N407 TaxID=3375154 RepID=UPI00378E3818
MSHSVGGPYDQDGDPNETSPGRPSYPPRPPGPAQPPNLAKPPNMPGRPPVPGPPHMPGPPPPPMTPAWRRQYPIPPQPPPPPQPIPMFPPAPSEPRGILWAFVPFLSFGFGTPFSFLYAALRRQSWNLGATATGYGVATGSAMVMAASGDPVLAALSAIMFLMLWVSGSVHAFAVRPSIFPRAAPQNQRNEHAIKLAKYRRILREDARTLAGEDPALAHELRIGRPDLPRGYDDGGLIDVNHAPPETLALLPGLEETLVERIVRHREEHGGFFSAEELAVDVDLPPALLPQLSEYAIFLP